MQQDRIILKGMKFYGYHGVNTEEQVLGQPYVVDLSVAYGVRLPGQTDQLEDTVSYTLIYRIVKSVVEGDSVNLVETLATRIADSLLTELPLENVQVRVKKPRPPIMGAEISYSAIEIFRSREDPAE